MNKLLKPILASACVIFLSSCDSSTEPESVDVELFDQEELASYVSADSIALDMSEEGSGIAQSIVLDTNYYMPREYSFNKNIAIVGTIGKTCKFNIINKRFVNSYIPGSINETIYFALVENNGSTYSSATLNEHDAESITMISENRASEVYNFQVEKLPAALTISDRPDPLFATAENDGIELTLGLSSSIGRGSFIEFNVTCE